MCSTYFGGFTDKIDYNSITERGASHFSSDLERGTVPRSIAVEKCEAPLIVIKIWHRHLLHFSQRWCTYWEPDCTHLGIYDLALKTYS